MNTLDMLFHYCVQDAVTHVSLRNLTNRHVSLLGSHLAQLPNLKHISLSFCSSEDISVRELIEVLVPIVDRLTSIELKALGLKKQIDNEAYLKLLSLLGKSQVKRLSLDGCYCYIGGDFNVNESLAQLDELVLRNSLSNDFIYTNAANNIVRSLPQLTKLEISYCGNVEYNNELKAAIESGCKNLQELRISDSTISIPIRLDENEPNRSFTLLPNLKTLSINASISVDEAFFLSDPDWSNVFNRLTCFEYIEIEGTKQCENNISASDLYEVLKQCNNLKTLRLNKIENDRCNSAVFDFLLEEMATKSYEVVDLSETSIDSRALVNIIRFSPNLKELIARCPFSLHHQTSTNALAMNFGTEFLEEVDVMDIQSYINTHTVSNLTSVDLSNCMISEHFLVFLFASANRLEHLTLEGTIRCEQPISVPIPIYPPNLTLNKLRTVRAAGCDVSVALLIVQHLNHLRPKNIASLDLSHLVRVQNFFQAGDMKELSTQICLLLEKCVELYSLKVNGLEWFDDTCIEILKQTGSPINKLHVSHTLLSLDSLLSLNIEQMSSLQVIGCSPGHSLETMHELIGRCARMNKLSIDLTSCGITDTTINLLGTRCKYLTYLKIAGKPRQNQQVSESKLMDLLLNKLVSLRKVDLEFNPLSEQAFQTLEESLTKRRFSMALRMPYPEDTSESSNNNEQGWCSLQ